MYMYMYMYTYMYTYMYMYMYMCVYIYISLYHIHKQALTLMPLECCKPVQSSAQAEQVPPVPQPALEAPATAPEAVGAARGQAAQA